MSSNNGPDRRQLLKIFTIGGVATTVLLPAAWTKPIVRAVFVPAHAAASPSSSSSNPTTTLEGVLPPT